MQVLFISQDISQDQKRRQKKDTYTDLTKTFQVTLLSKKWAFNQWAKCIHVATHRAFKNNWECTDIPQSVSGGRQSEERKRKSSDMDFAV